MERTIAPRLRSGATDRSLTSIGLIGLAATIAVVMGGAVSGAADPEGTGRLWSVPAIPVRPTVHLVPGLLAYFGGLIVMVRSWLHLRRYHLTHGLTVGAVAAIVVVWSVPFLLGPPLGSRDVYAYAAQGRLAEQGFDVYQEGPAELGSNDPVLAPVDPLYRQTPSLYGPVFVAASSVIAAVVDDHVINAVMAFRLLAVVGLVASAVAVFDLSRGLGRDPVDALILALANPLVLLHLVSGAHNEAMMLGFLMVGVACARRGLLHIAIVLCALAAAVKLPAVLAVAFIGWSAAMDQPTLAARLRRLTIVGAEAVAVLAVTGWLTGLGWGWIDAMVETKPVDAYLSVSRVLGGGISLLLGLDPDRILAATRLLGMVVAAGATGALLLLRSHAWPSALAWSLVAAAVLHPTTQPWYLTWGVILLAAVGGGDRNRALVTACAAAVFVVLPMGPQLGLVVLDSAGPATLIAGLLVLSVLTYSPARSRQRRYRTGLDPGTVSLVVPTRNERPNIETFVQRVDELMEHWEMPGGLSRVEILFVDDSDDGSADEVRRVAASRANPAAVDVLHRHPQQRWGGLGGAVVDGFAVAGGATVVVMDGDLQHPASQIPAMVEALASGSTQVVVASRRVDGGSFGDGLTPWRRRLSLGSAALARLMFPVTVAPVSDPLSGFFALRLDRLDLNRLQPDGFKILVEVLATHPSLTVTEVPFEFSGRIQGVSKASASEGVRYLGHLIELRVRTSRLWAGAPLTQQAFGPPGMVAAGPGGGSLQPPPGSEPGF